MEEYIIWLKDAGPSKFNLIGGKGSNLGELSRGLTSPPGFVVSSLAYRKHVAQNNTKQIILDSVKNCSLDNLDDIEKLCHKIKDLVLSLPMPADVAEVITKAYYQLNQEKVFHENLLVAVRSSATAEDQDDASFAGQQDTYLNVEGLERVLMSVKECWASLWTARAIHYRNIKGYDNETVEIAVIIQEMLPAEISGVMFTANPVSNSRGEILIEAARGLGEELVSGMVTGDNYVISRDGLKILSKTVADKERGQLLADEKVRHLANIGMKIEEYYDNNVQDIEWALYRGEFYFLQSRPITTLADEEPEDVDWDKLNPIQKELLTTIYERFPEPIYPIDGVTVISFFKGQFDAMDIFGYTVPDMDWGRVEMGIFPEFFIPPDIKPNYKQLFLLLNFFKTLKTDTAKEWRIAQNYLNDRLKTLGELDFSMFPNEILLEYLDEAIAKFHAYITLRYEYFTKNRLPARVLSKILESAFGPEGKDLHLKLLVGIHCITIEINDALRDLCLASKEYPAIQKLILERSGNILEDIRQLPGGEEYLAKYNDFINKYGDRETTIGLGGLANPTWKESPEVVFSMMRSILNEQPGTEEARKQRLTNERLEAEAQIKEHFSKGLYKFLPTAGLVKKLIKHNQSYAVFREDSHYDMTKGLSVIKELFLEFGRRFVKLGFINETLDIYFLTYYDTRKIIGDHYNHKKIDVKGIKKRIEERKLERVRRIGRWQTKHIRDAVLENNQLKGIPAGGGVYTGTARIINGPEDFDKLQAGDILVAPYTNPAWTPLFVTAAGLVVDIGGAASHAAIIAREYGIPAVMGVTGASKAIKDGDKITINGYTGIINIEVS